MDKRQLLMWLVACGVGISALVVVFVGRSVASDDDDDAPKCATSWQHDLAHHSYSDLKSDRAALSFLAEGLADEKGFKAHLDKVLVERQMGSAGHDEVESYLRETLSALGWDVEEREPFRGVSPDDGKEWTFSNVVAHLDKDSPRRIVIACHYDSKSSMAGFVGATDSAAPCAMMLHLAQALGPALRLRVREQPGLSVSMVFFDGEEAFGEWKDDNSLYGSKHLAKEWKRRKYEGSCQEGEANQLDRIQVMALLDLLGAENPKFKNYRALFDPATGKNVHYDEMRAAETALRAASPSSKVDVMFAGKESAYLPSDDHSPFVALDMRRLLYLIPAPFPDTWHTTRDDLAHLDLIGAVPRLNALLRIWAAQVLGMDRTDLERAYGKQLDE